MVKASEKKKNSKTNTNNSKHMLIALVIVFIIGVAIAGFGISSLSDQNKEPVKNENGISKELVKDKTYEGLTFKDINIESRDKVTVLSANVVNNSATTFEEGIVNIVFYAEGDKKMGSQVASMANIPSKETHRIEVVIDEKYKDANTLKIEKAEQK